MIAPSATGPKRRQAPVDMQWSEFRELGHRLVDQLADRLANIAAGPVVRDESPAVVRRAFASEQTLPAAGCDPAVLLEDTTRLLFDHSVFNAHPRFFAYITSSPAPIGILGEFLAAALNQNVGAWRLAPLATEIEKQTVRWIAELIGMPAGGDGLLVSGGNMANFVGVIAARAAKAGEHIRRVGLSHGGPRLLLYTSIETHTWVQKAADLFGLGTDAIRWIATDDQQRMDARELNRQVEQDLADGGRPFLVVATAGSVSTGAVDPLSEIAAICRAHDLWFHVDGAYGALAANVPGAPPSLQALREADSVAVDPHKWLYAPLEAGCVLVRNPNALRNAFSYHPPYYQFDEQVLNYFDHGPQNSRGFRALKVWLALQQVGRRGCLEMMGDDMLLAQHLHRCLEDHPDFEATSHNLSITTFRYVPRDLAPRRGIESVERYLGELNQQLLAAVERSGEAFLSNAVIGQTFVLRACVVNFHTSLGDIEALAALVARLGGEVDAALRREAVV
jgi:aromatic-L-amino-acid decarboxylase